MTSSPTKLMDTGKVTSAMSTLTLKVRPVPGKYIRSQKGLFSLCQLPIDIRDLIYEFALVEPKRRDIEHTPDCSGYSKSFKYLEPPAFLLKDIVISEEPHRLFWDLDGFYWPREPLCRCDQRKGLGLLLASKQVHAEAAPIFWSKNTFSFLSGYEVITALNHLLRPKYRDLVSSISVLRMWSGAMGLILADDVKVPKPEGNRGPYRCVGNITLWVSSTCDREASAEDKPRRPHSISQVDGHAGMHQPLWRTHKGEIIYAETSSKLKTVQELRSSDEEPCLDFWKKAARERKNLLCRTREAIAQTCLRNFDEPHSYRWHLRRIIDSKEKRFVRLDLGEGRFSSVKFYGLPASLKETRQIAWDKHLKDEEFRKLKGMYPSHSNLKTWCPFFKRIVEEEGLDEEQSAELWETGYTYTVYSDSEPSRTEPSYTEPIIGSATCHLPRAISNRRASKKVLKDKKKATRTDAENRRKEKKRDHEWACRESLLDDDVDDDYCY
ncbi:hypothetical protein BDP81DRAFT_405694 [Colletotrichum phormii]|uniref:Uncharacterized protein n=1 Tax=Colletotrichum phormii TaxID=359342 RepID=A0AAJ0EI25_9PEZI|nr:uncharacterized protein BDP81DRAFT_405694 [Colletotrichum phormii]KAK1637646.1 hypothetical protein BDP81DRAFT_405694 [Colletotrichum phormii]